MGENALAFSPIFITADPLGFAANGIFPKNAIFVSKSDAYRLVLSYFVQCVQGIPPNFGDIVN